MDRFVLNPLRFIGAGVAVLLAFAALWYFGAWAWEIAERPLTIANIISFLCVSVVGLVVVGLCMGAEDACMSAIKGKA